MKNIRPIIGLFWILLYVNSNLNAQEAKKKKYFFVVKMMAGGDHRKGILKAIDGPNLIILIRRKGPDSLMSISSSEIRVVRIIKVNAGRHIIKGTGIIIGATAGAVLGYYIGSTPDPECEDGSCIDWGPIGQGVIGGVVGGVAGSYLSNPGKKYVINGMTENFEKMKMHLTE